MTEQRKVCILHTGGTIGMRRSDEGWVPARGHLEALLAEVPAFRAEGMPEYAVVELDPLLDSAEMGPAEWCEIAGRVEALYDDYDGFVVLHGTDTMAYTASALAFVLEGLSKTVILTGSQVPLCRPRNDAQENLVGSLQLASDYRIPEVGVYFNSRLYRGCRTVKVKCDSLDAFDSPNLPPLATAGTRFEVDKALIRWPDPSQPPSLTLHPCLDRHVGVLWIFPGMTADIVSNLLAPPLKGVVLQAFGVGNGPVNDPDFMDALRAAAKRDVVIVDCTQCLTGSVNLGDYATGSALARVGVISGYDLTLEAALTKLMHLFGRGLPPDEVRRQVQTDLRGELTIPVS